MKDHFAPQPHRLSPRRVQAAAQPAPDPRPALASAIGAAVLFLLLTLMTGCASSSPPQTVAFVDLRRYAGTWHEIARFPQPYEKGCTAATAKYIPTVANEFIIINTCHEGEPDGAIRRVEGTAKVIDKTSGAKWKVHIPPGPPGDYWILELDPNYEYAAVGTPDRQSLWLLSRGVTMPSEVYQSMVNRLAEKGFDPMKLKLTER